MKTFFVSTTVRAGEYEKRVACLVEAFDSDLAQEYAVLLESHDSEQLEWEDRGAADMGWEFFYQYHDVREVPEEHLPVMEQYLSKFTYDPSDFASAGNYKEWKMNGLKEDDFIVLDAPLPLHSNYRKLAGKVRGLYAGKLSVCLTWGVENPVEDEFISIDGIVTAVAPELCRKLDGKNEHLTQSK